MAAAEATADGAAEGTAEGAAPRAADLRRRWWFGATLTSTVGAVVAAVALAPDRDARPTHALVWLLFVGSSLHVGATGWFATVPQVRAHMAAHRERYVVAPLVLVAGWTAVAAATDERTLAWLLLGFFAWQFHHFQKQNLGVAALAARAFGAAPPTRLERRTLVAAGVGGTAALLGHPQLLQLVGVPAHDALFDAGLAVFVAAVGVGLAALARRPAADRPAAYVGVHVVGLLFFLPVFCSASPYAAVAGLTVAHGLQYLLLVGLLAAHRPAGTRGRVGLLVLFDVALPLGVLLNWASHRHGGGAAERAVYGAYLGLVSAHFVVDAGLWRLRDAFPRAFLTERLPFLLRPRVAQGTHRPPAELSIRGGRLSRGRAAPRAGAARGRPPPGSTRCRSSRTDR